MEISSLNSEHRIRLAEMHHEWLANLASGEPLDRDAVTTTLAELYYYIRKPAPRILIFSSPPMCLLAWAALTTRTERWGRLREQLSPPLRELWDRLPDQLEAQIQSRGEERKQLGRHLTIGLADSLRHVKERVPYALETCATQQIDPAFWKKLHPDLLYQLRGHWQFDHVRREWTWPSDPEVEIWGQRWNRPVDGHVADLLPRELRDQLAEQGYLLRTGIGNAFNHDNYSLWETFYKFCGEIGVEYPPEEKKLLDLYHRSSRALHWWFPFDNVVLASERHGPPSVDERGQLHAVEGLACQYSDGWGICSWHGIIIPVKYSQPTAPQVLHERNAELRRVLMERYDHVHGKGSFLIDCGAKVLDSAVQPMRPGQPDSINELLSVDLMGDPDMRMTMLKVIDPSTGRTYMLRVPPNQTTVRGALAWTFDLRPEEYELDQET
jgi:hypothetical protein